MKGTFFRVMVSALSLTLALMSLACASAGAKGKESASTLVGNTETINLATVEPSVSGGAKYLEDAKKVDVQDIEYFKFKLARALKTGDSVKVHVTGENLGKVGFRSWLVNKNIVTLSDIMKTADAAGFKAGDFELNYSLKATGDVEYLFFKGPVYGTNIDHITIKSITVTY